MNTAPANPTPSPLDAKTLFIALVCASLIGAGASVYGIVKLYPYENVIPLVLALLVSLAGVILAGWMFYTMLQSAREISRAAASLAEGPLAEMTTACDAMREGNFEEPMQPIPPMPLPVRSGGEIGAITGNFNRMVEAVNAVTAAFANARGELHESYRSLWENNDTLLSELPVRKETEEKLVKTQRQLEAKLEETQHQLNTVNMRFEQELAEHKRTEDGMQRWEQIFNNSGLAMATLHATNDTLLTVSPTFATMHGYHPQELIGQSIERLVAPDARQELSSHAKNTNQKKNYVYEALHLRRDGSKFPVVVNSTAITDMEGNVLYRAANFQDVTERRNAEQLLKTAKDDAEKEVRARSQFLANMSLELRTPLNVILGFSQLLEMNLPDPEHQESAQHIIKAGKHLLALINEVLDISRIDADKVSLSLQVVPVGEPMLSAMAQVRPLATERKIEFFDQLNNRGAKHVMADSQRLQQVFHNLLSNAVKYNKPGGRVTVWSSERKGNQIAISVTDTGSGIPAEKLSQLFTPFERLGADETGIEGTGLGLALSKRLVELMDGTLEVSSVPGEGSTFSVVLPMTSSPVKQLERLSDDRLTAREKSALPVTSRLLYIEEDMANVRLLEKLMKPYHKIGLLTAQTGVVGVQLAMLHRPDLILLDLDFADKSGEEVLRQLRKDHVTNDIPVVVISADTMPRRIEQMIKQGATQYLTKPIDVNKLLVVIGGTINIREQMPA